MSLKASIAETAIFQRLQKAARDGIAVEDILFARQSDIDPNDVRWLRTVTRRERLLLVVRCPKAGSVAWHGILPPKRWADGHDSLGAAVKSGASGVGVHPETGHIFVSDYDMMCLWQREHLGGAFRKIFASALIQGAERGAWSVQGRQLVRIVNVGLRSKLQHGAQDDYVPPAGKKHPNVEMGTRFAAFCEGDTHYLPNAELCKDFYKRNGLPWPYNSVGQFIGQT
jgi:hypothetical protein